MTTEQRTARLYQQCWSSRDCKVGSYLMADDHSQQVSPTFSDSYALFQWCRSEGWTSDGALQGRYTKKEPTC